MNNLLSYCGLVDARISASEKDLSVPSNHFNGIEAAFNLGTLSTSRYDLNGCVLRR